jgi:uncharacterized protein (TIGR03663 family)
MAGIQAWTETVDDRLSAVGLDRVTAAVWGLVVAGLLARLVALGARVAHFDEGRVGYWIGRYVETGDFHYRYIIHGPFVQHVDHLVFSLFGANDFTLRLVVAVVGAALPLVVLLFREHLDGTELVVAALFLAGNPILLYYSRFFRSTVPVAVFAFAAFGFAVRYWDTRRARYLYAFSVLLALAFTAKENAAVYVLVWLGASGLLLDHELFRPRSAATGTEVLRDWWDRNVRRRELRRDLPRFLGHVVVMVLLFAAVILFFYAPRAGSPGGVGLYNAVGNPGLFPEVVDATVADLEEGYGYWFGGATESGHRSSLVDKYVGFSERLVGTLATYAAVLVGFAVAGFLKERFASANPRNLVMFASYWGAVSFVGYPLGTDIYGPWLAVNVVVPLTIPAAVALATVLRWGRDALAREDSVSLAVAVFVVVLTVSQMAFLGVSSAYASPLDDENMVQYAQPGDDMKPALREMGAAAADTDGTDVLLYGSYFVSDGANPDSEYQPACANWFQSLPLPWYFQVHDATVDCARTVGEIAEDGDAPPVVITRRSELENVSAAVPEYETRTYQLRRYGTEVTIFVDPEYATESS